MAPSFKYEHLMPPQSFCTSEMIANDFGCIQTNEIEHVSSLAANGSIGAIAYDQMQICDSIHLDHSQTGEATTTHKVSHHSALSSMIKT
jgi:hypothetical protein